MAAENGLKEQIAQEAKFKQDYASQLDAYKASESKREQTLLAQV